MPEELIIFRLCERFGWTVADIESTPAVLIDRFISIISIEGQLAKIEMDSSGR